MDNMMLWGSAHLWFLVWIWQWASARRHGWQAIPLPQTCH